MEVEKGHCRAVSFRGREVRDRKRRKSWRPIRVRIRVARLVLPGLKVHCLGWSDTEQDSQDFWISYPLSQRGVQAGGTLLNEGKVKARGEGDRADEVAALRGRISISSGNRRVLRSIVLVRRG